MRVTSSIRTRANRHPESRRTAARSAVLTPLLLMLALAPPLAAAEAAGGRDAAGQAADRVLEAAWSFARAKLLADAGAFDEALEAYDESLELDGADPYSRIEVAKFHSYLSQISRSAEKRVEYLESAAGYAGEARRLAPENLEILRTYAQIHLRLGEHRLAAMDRAQEAFEQLRRETEGDLQVLTSLGQIYLWRQEGEKAVEVLEEAARYLPGHRMIQTMLLEALLESGRKLDAERVLEKLIEIEPESLDYRMRLAELASERGDHREAAAVLRSAPEDLLDNTRLRRVLAQELHLAGAHEEALALTERLKEEIPYGSGMRRLRVAILSSLTRYEEAIAELEPVLESEQDAGRKIQGALHLSRLLERVGRPQEAAAVLRSQGEAPEASARLQLQLALTGVLERDDRPREAADLLRRELEGAEAAQVPLLGRALSDLLSRMGSDEEALAVLDRTAERLGPDADAGTAEGLKLRRVALLLAAGKWDRAEQEAAALGEAASGEVAAAAVVLRAEALAGSERIDEALEVLSAATGDAASRHLAKKAEILFAHAREGEAAELLREVVDRGEAGDLFFAAQVYQRSERYHDSIPLLERLLERDDDSLQALFLIGAAHERVGDRERAAAAFQRLLELAPDHAPTLNYLGYMWAETGENLPEAVELILRAVALEPDNGAYVDSLGWAYFQLGRYQEALGHLEWAARLIPDDATILEHLGDLYVALKDRERARASYRQALDLGGDLETVRRKLETLDQEDL